MRLGRLPHDPVRLAAAPRHTLAGGTLAPPRLIRDHLPFVPGLYRNDTLPDCTAAALANAARAYAWARRGADLAITGATVPAYYAACAGCADTDAAMEATDGVMLQDAIDRAATQGADFGQQVPLVPAGATVDPRDRQALAHATMTGGAVVLGLALATADQQAAGAVWDTGTPGDQTAGSWGGHAAILWAYGGLADDAEIRIGTWGTWQTATWRWLDARLEEAWRLTWAQL